MKKRIAAILLAVVLAAVYMPVSASALAIWFSGDCGENLTWTLDGKGVLTISGTGEMTDFDAHAYGWQEPWYDMKDSIREIRIESGVTSIGTDAFEHCHYVEKVTIPGTVERIGQYAFLMNIALEEVTIPEGVTTLEQGAFQYCEKLRKADLPGTIRNIGACAFCEDPITEAVIPQGVAVIEWSTFQDCLELQSVVIPDSVTKIGKNAFKGCTSLTSVSGGSHVEDLGGNVFAGTPWLEAQGDFVVLGSTLAAYNGSTGSAVLPAGITKIGEGAFEGHSELKKVTFSGSEKEIGARAFADCTGLTELKMPDSVVKAGEEAFAGCKSLKTVKLSKKLAALGTKAFANCSALAEIAVPAALKEADEPFADCSGLKKIIWPDKMTVIPESLFKNCTGLSALNLPETLKTIEDEAFAGCTGLPEILLPETLEKIGWRAFYGCSGVRRVYIPIRAASIGSGAFAGCADGLEVYYGGSELDFFRLDEGTQYSMANGYAPYFNAVGFTLPDVDEPDPGELMRSGRYSVRKPSWSEICDGLDLLVSVPENLYQKRASLSKTGYSPAVLNAEAVQYYQDEINYFRQVAGVDPIVLTDELNESAAWGALVQAMNGVMSHYPEQPAGMSDEDFARASYAASHGNLSYSSPPDPLWAVLGQIDDSDSRNAHDLGHRRWLLSPYTAKMGVGIAENDAGLFTTVRVFGDGSDEINVNDYDFVSWPASGKNLSDTFSPAVIWSVSLNPKKYDRPLYNEVKVNVRNLQTGTEWLLSKDATQDTDGWFNVSNNGYGGMDTIVFQPNTRVGYQGDYLVTVTGLHLLKDGSSAEIQYKVTFKYYDEARNASDDSDDPPVGPKPPVVQDPDNPFLDVAAGKYCYDSVLWAVKQGITKGTSDTTFEPDKVCTRAQVVTFLWRAQGSPEPDSAESPFLDVTDRRSSYYKAVLWAAENGITAGVDRNHFAPNQQVTRAQFVTFLWRAAGEEPAGSGKHPFVDIAGPGSWYYEAVLWAVENGVTNGVDKTHFGPGNGCTRGQVVTFLYRLFG